MIKCCKKCGETKPTIEFSKRAGTHDGLQYQCKSCCKASYAAWRTANLGKDRARAAAWTAANPDKRKAIKVEWDEANPGYIVRWNAANPEVKRVHNHNRRARKREAGGKLSKGLSEKLFKLQRGKCACGCQQPLGDDYHLDHLMPLALGGPNEDRNMQLLRAKCNLQKSKKHPVDFMQQRGFLL